MIFLFLHMGCKSTPCQSALPEDSGSLVDIFRRLETEQCLHEQDIVKLREQMNAYHRKTTVHCDQIFRRSSIDGFEFDGPEELVISNGSVADVWIEANGSHIIVYNDVTPDKLISLAGQRPEKFWKMGLVGFGGLGLAKDPMTGDPVEYLNTDLHLQSPLELVDPDIGRDKNGNWVLTFFGVTPLQMDDVQFGPMSAAKPHRFYQSKSPNLEDFPTPKVIVASSEGSNGGTDPAWIARDDGSEIFVIGPLDQTTMGWVHKGGWLSTDGLMVEDDMQGSNTRPPDFNSRMRFATPDLVKDPKGGYRLYGMTNGRPGEFQVATSKDGIKYQNPKIVLSEKGAFNISVGVDNIGMWWVYYNKTNPGCVSQWGSQKVLPF